MDLFDSTSGAHVTEYSHHIPSIIIGTSNLFFQVIVPVHGDKLIGSFDSAAAAGGAYIGVCFYAYLLGLILGTILLAKYLGARSKAAKNHTNPPYPYGILFAITTLIALPISFLITNGKG